MTLLLAMVACGNGTTPDTTVDVDDTEAANALATAASVEVTVTPGEGPSGSMGTITVTGEPNQIVIIQVAQPNGFEYQLSGTSNATGVFTDTGSFTGDVGDVITITAIVGPTQDSPSATTTFTITGLEDSTTTTSTTTTTTTAPTTTTTTTMPPTTTTTVASVGFSGGSLQGSIGPGAAAIGQTIHLSACGLQAGEMVEWSFLGLLVEGNADDEGCLQLSMTIPAATPAGAHPMEISGDQGSYAELEYTVL